MSTRLSSLLVQASVVSVRQIERALQRQVLRGGQLDTNLLELGVSEQDVLPHLGKARDLEPAARSVWPLPPEDILALIPRDLAQKHEVAPLGKEGGRLYVLSHESFDAAALAELSGRLGLAVVPVIIPEFRVHEALERYYRIPMPPRSAALAAKLPIPEPTWEEVREDLPWIARPHSSPAIAAGSYTASSPELKATPPEAPSEKSDETAPPTPLKEEAPASPTGEEAAPPEALSQDARPLAAEPAPLPETTEPASPVAEAPLKSAPPTPQEAAAAPEVRAKDAQAKSPAAPEAPPAPRAEPALPPPQRTQRANASSALDRFTQALDAATHRDQILLEALLFAQRPGQSILLFQVQAEPPLAIGRDLLRPGHPPAQIQGVTIPLAKSPILRRAMELKAFQPHIPLEDTSLLDLFGALSLTPPALVFVLPVVLKDRVVALLLGGEGPGSDLTEIAPVGHLVSRALMGLIRKKKAPAAPPPVSPDEDAAPRPNSSPAAQAHEPSRPFAPPPPRSGWSSPSTTAVPSPQEVAGLPPEEALTAPLGGRPAQDAVPRSPAYAHSDEITVPKLPAVQKPASPPDLPPPPNEDAAENEVEAVGEENPPLEENLAALEEEAKALLSQDNFMEQSEQEAAASKPHEEPSPEEEAHPKAQTVQNEETILEDSTFVESDEIELVEEETPHPPQPSNPRQPVPIALPTELLLQTERLEQESIVLSTLEELIQPKRKKAPQDAPSSAPQPPPLLHEEIHRLVDLIDLGQTPSGQPASLQELNNAAERLLSFGEPALARLIEIFPGRRPPNFSGSPRPEEGGVVRVILRFGSQALPALSRISKSQDPIQRLYATWCIASMKDPEIVPILLERLFDEDPLVYQLAGNGLFTWRTRFPGHPAFEIIHSTLQKALESEEPGHRLTAARSARELRLISLLPALVERLEDPVEAVADAAYYSLVNLTFQNFGFKKKAWLSWIEKNRHRPREAWLIEALSDREAEVRKAAASELYYLTRLTFGYDPEGPKGERKKAIKQWEDWLQSQNS